MTFVDRKRGCGECPRRCFDGVGVAVKTYVPELVGALRNIECKAEQPF